MFGMKVTIAPQRKRKAATGEMLNDYGILEEPLHPPSKKTPNAGLHLLNALACLGHPSNNSDKWNESKAAIQCNAQTIFHFDASCEEAVMISSVSTAVAGVREMTKSRLHALQLDYKWSAPTSHPFAKPGTEEAEQVYQTVDMIVLDPPWNLHPEIPSDAVNSLTKRMFLNCARFAEQRLKHGGSVFICVPPMKVIVPTLVCKERQQEDDGNDLMRFFVTIMHQRGFRYVALIFLCVCYIFEHQ